MPEVIAAKLAYYKSHALNRAVLPVRQDRLGVTFHPRLRASRWSERELTAAADDVVELPEVGRIGTVGQLYRYTPLDPAKAR
jgi:hypothetical protein